MRPWENKRTRAKMRAMSGERSLKLFFELYKGAIEMVKGTLAKGSKRSKKALRLEIGRLSGTIGRL